MSGRRWADRARLIVFPFDGFDRISLPLQDPLSRDSTWSRGSLPAYVAALAPGTYAILGFFDVFALFTDLGFTFALGNTLGDLHVLSRSSAVAALAFALALRFAIYFPVQWLEVRATELACIACRRSLAAAAPTSKDDAKIRALVTRDIPRLITGSRCWVQMISTAASLVCAAAFLVWLDGGLAAFGALTILIFAPFSLFLSGRRSKIVAQTFSAMQRRMDSLSLWVKHRLRLHAWGVGEEVSVELTKEARYEARLRGRDARYRVLDIYVMLFGKALPTATIIALTAAAGAASLDYTTALWTSTLLILQTLKLGRFRSLAADGQAALASARELFTRLSPPRGGGATLDDTCEIWEGSLSANTLGDATALLDALGLVDELGLRAASSAESMLLSRDGGNISAGQRARVLLARAILSCRAESVPLRIESIFSSLDPDAARRVLAVVETENRDGVSVSLSDASKASLERIASVGGALPSLRASQTRSEASRKGGGEGGASEGVARPFVRISRRSNVVMLLPVLVLSATGAITGEHRGPLRTAFVLVVVAMLGIAMSFALGIRAESGVRQWAVSRLATITRSPRVADANDLFQQLGRDFSTVCDRVAVYLHDITWLLFMFATTAIAMIATFGGLAAVACGAIGLAYFGVWSLFNPLVVRARRALVGGSNEAMGLALDAARVGSSLSVESARAAEARLRDRAFDVLFRRTVELDTVRAFSIHAALLVSGLLTLSVAYAATRFELDASIRAFLGTGLVNLDLRAGILFAALTGFATQSISVERLNRDAPARPPAGDRLVTFGDEIEIGPFAHPEIAGISYRRLSLRIGQATVLSAPSGFGKSLYLSAVGELAKNVAYLDGESPTVLAWLSAKGGEPSAGDSGALGELLMGFWRSRVASGYRLLVLDETLATLSEDDARALVRDLTTVSDEAAVLFVDHRIAWEVSASMQAILERGPIVSVSEGAASTPSRA